MSRIQYLMEDDKPVAVQIPIDLWKRMRELAEEAEDIADIERFDRDDDGVRVPLEVVEAKLNGAHSVKAWREHKKLTLQAVADAAGLSKAFVSQIERGLRTGSAATLKRLAVALDVPVGALMD
jgi:DNA-binding XRE family transcriptional regulator